MTEYITMQVTAYERKLITLSRQLDDTKREHLLRVVQRFQTLPPGEAGVLIIEAAKALNIPLEEVEALEQAIEAQFEQLDPFPDEEFE